MAQQLDIKVLSAGFNCIKIGVLNQEVINLLNLNRSKCDIILWEDRFKYIEKHKGDFKSEQEFYYHISQIPEIIENPDYVAKHPTTNSIEYIKRINELMLVAIRIRDKGNLALRSAYPLSEEQLNDYLIKGTAYKMVK
jgi:hypothetical protein